MKEDYRTDEILKLLLERDYVAIEKALKNGFAANTMLNQKSTGIELASYIEDIRMVEIFWKYGAAASTGYLQEIVAAFEKGKTYLDFEKKEDVNKNLNLSENFSVSKLIFLKGTISQNENKYYQIELPIAAFIFEQRTVETKIDLTRIILPKSLSECIGENISFPINPTEGYVDGSIYLAERHNPVDVYEITFISQADNLLELEMKMIFNFEYEGTGLKNEKLTKSIFLSIQI